MGLYLIFGIIGLRTLGGKFWSCNDASVTYRWQCVGTYLNEARRYARELLPRLPDKHT